MPRDAPVTSATFPDKSSMSRWSVCLSPGERELDRLEIVRTAERDDLRAGMDFLHEAAQYRPWTHLNIRCDALRRKALDDRLPFDRRRDLADERLDCLGRGALRVRVDVGDDRHPRIGRA